MSYIMRKGNSEEVEKEAKWCADVADKRRFCIFSTEVNMGGIC